MNIIKIISEKLTQNNYLITSGESAVIIDGSADVSQIEENLKLFNPKPRVKAIILTRISKNHLLKQSLKSIKRL